MTEEDALELCRQNVMKPCRLYCGDGNILQSFTNASRNLLTDGLVHMNDTSDEIPPSVSESKTFISKAVDKIAAMMMELNHRLYHGNIYQLHKKGLEYFSNIDW